MGIQTVTVTVETQLQREGRKMGSSLGALARQRSSGGGREMLVLPVPRGMTWGEMAGFQFLIYKMGTNTTSFGASR